MKLAFKVLLLIVLIVIGKMGKQNTIINKPSKSLYSPVYSHNSDFGANSKSIEGNEIKKISVKYYSY